MNHAHCYHCQEPITTMVWGVGSYRHSCHSCGCSVVDSKEVTDGNLPQTDMCRSRMTVTTQLHCKQCFT